jgi:hypothetical protein
LLISEYRLFYKGLLYGEALFFYKIPPLRKIYPKDIADLMLHHGLNF